MGSTETKAKRTKRRTSSSAGDAFVLLAMTFTTVALAIGLYLQFRLAFWLAVVAALSVYVGLLALHVLVRRSERVEHLTAEIQRLEAELSQVSAGASQGHAVRPAGGPPPVPHSPGHAPAPIAIGGIGNPQPRQAAAAQAPAIPEAAKPAAKEMQAKDAQPRPDASTRAEGKPRLDDPTGRVAAEAADAPARPAHTDRPAMSDRAVDAIMNDYWAFRPAQPPRLPEPAQAGFVLPGAALAGAEPAAAQATAPPIAPPPVAPVEAASVPTAPPALPLPVSGHPAAPLAAARPPSLPEARSRAVTPPPVPATPPPMPSSPRQSDVDMIGGLIKKMADEINAVESGRLRNASGGDRVPPSAIEASVNALRTTADQMRGPAPLPSEPSRATGEQGEPRADARHEPRPDFASRVFAGSAAPTSEAARPSPPSRAPTPPAPQPIAAVPPPLPAPSSAPARQAVPNPPAARHALDRPAARALPTEDEAGRFAAAPWPVDPASGAPEIAATVQAPAEAIIVPAAPAPQTPPVAHSRLAALAEAITAGRLDVLLDPILGLADQRARHFEVSVRLRDKSGNVLEPPDGVPELRESGLLPLLDCARIQRSALVAHRLADRGKPGSLFSAFSGESLSHDQFLADFADLYATREGLSSQLVLSFGQADVRSFSSRDWDTIAEMHELGFRFALQSVTDLDFDLEALKSAGFDFVKLDASVFLDGMPASGGVIPAADICRHLAQLGMTLIVGRIDDETQLARIFGFGVIYGQGQLFGGARPMKSEALSDAGHAAA